MSIRTLISLVVVMTMTVFAGGSTLQAQSLFGGGTTGGSSGFGGAAGNTGTSGFGTAATGQGGRTSQTNVGQELGTTNLNAADGSLSATVGQSAFVGAGNSGNFVGNRFAGQTASQSVQPQFGNLQQNNRSTNNNRQSRDQRKSVRPQYRIAFEAPAIPPQQILARFQPQTGLRLPPISSDVELVALDVDHNGVVKLSGTVTSERDSKLLESYVRMEPGVRDVKNELTIREQP